MTPTLIDAMSSPVHWLVLLATLLMVVSSAGVHYEILNRLSGRMQSWKIQGHRRIVLMIGCLLGAHVAEIWIFGLGLFAMLQMTGSGELMGIETVRALDAIYLSATTYTTVGYGDVVPTGPVRFILGTEALLGLLLIAWSASFTYLEMQRYWND